LLLNQKNIQLITNSSFAKSSISAALRFNKLQSTTPKTIIFPGGNSPLKFFNHVVKIRQAWENVTIIPSDERLVPVTDDHSNYRMIKKSCLEKIDQHCRPRLFDFNKPIDQINNLISKLPLPSITVLGFGTDGHTASLFPGHGMSKPDNNKYVIKVKKDKEPFERISLTFNYILKSNVILLLLYGNEKAKALNQTMTGKYNPDKWPVQYILKNYDGNIYIYCDDASASLLPN